MGQTKKCVSVVIATYNRAEVLREVLLGLVAQTLDSATFEVLVVDNGSTDDTSQVVNEEFEDVTNIHYLHEPIQGANHARDKGWRTASGHVCAFLDDDAVPEPVWLEKILEGFELFDPIPGAVGGRIEPVWGGEPGAWMDRRLRNYLTIVDASPRPCVLGADQFLPSANLAISREALCRIGGFGRGYGRSGNSLLSGEETLVEIKLRELGYTIAYHPEASVRHHIPAARLEPSWFSRRAFWQGVSDYQIDRYRHRDRYGGHVRLLLWGLWECAIAPRSMLALICPVKMTATLSRRCDGLKKLGYMAGLFVLQQDGMVR